MELKLDLHIHSHRSPDGSMTLEEIVARARGLGLDGAAVCDHDRVLEGDADFPGFLLIPGVEVSTDQGHLLGLFVTRPVEERSLSGAAAAIRAQGGIVVLAHPFARLREEGALDSLAPLLDGAEVWNGRAERKNSRANAMAAGFVRRHGLLPFGGSDAHLPQEIGNGITTITVQTPTLQAVKEALLAGNASVSGVRGRARYVALSQLTKRRKTGAGPLAYGKWALFALKCCAQDALDRLGGEGGA